VLYAFDRGVAAVTRLDKSRAERQKRREQARVDRRQAITLANAQAQEILARRPEMRSVLKGVVYPQTREAERRRRQSAKETGHEVQG